MFAEVLDPQREFMFPIVLSNLSKKFYCSRQSFLGLLGRASFRTYHRVSLYNIYKICFYVLHGRRTGKSGADPKTLTWFLPGPYYEINRFSVWQNFTSEQVLGSLTIAWSKCSHVHLIQYQPTRHFHFRSRRGWSLRCAFVHAYCTHHMHQHAHKLLWGIKWYFLWQLHLAGCHGPGSRRKHH